jgi:ATP-dependent helicase YprA (DUF1998 family)
MENEVPRTLGEVDAASAAWMVHPDAIYLHEAQIYLVDSLDLEHHIAYLRKTGVDYYTEPKRQISVDLLDIFLNAQLKGAQKNYGEIRVTTQVTGFRKVSWYTHENLGTGDLTLPPSELQTMAYWLSIDQETIEGCANRDFGAARLIIMDLAGLLREILLERGMSIVARFVEFQKKVVLMMSITKFLFVHSRRQPRRIDFKI